MPSPLKRGSLLLLLLLLLLLPPSLLNSSKTLSMLTIGAVMEGHSHAAAACLGIDRVLILVLMSRRRWPLSTPICPRGDKLVA
jgi:hypothetical protein